MWPIPHAPYWRSPPVWRPMFPVEPLPISTGPGIRPRSGTRSGRYSRNPRSRRPPRGIRDRPSARVAPAPHDSTAKTREIMISGVRFDVSPKKTIRELEREAREAEAREDYRRAAELRERAERIRRAAIDEAA